MLELQGLGFRAYTQSFEGVCPLETHEPNKPQENTISLCKGVLCKGWDFD